MIGLAGLSGKVLPTIIALPFLIKFNARKGFREDTGFAYFHGKISRDLCKTSPFVQSLRLPCGIRSLFLWGQAQILILKIRHVFLRLKFSPFLALNKIEHFSKVSSLYGAKIKLWECDFVFPYNKDFWA